MTFEYRTLLGLPTYPKPRDKWFRGIFLFRADENFALWQRWCTHELAWFWRACLSPYQTPKQARVTAMAYFYNWSLSVTQMEERMAKNGTKKSSIAISRWVSFNLDDDDKRAIQQDTPTLSDVVASFGSLCFSGYRLSISWDSYSSAVQASLVCTNEESPNAGIGVSARHPDIDMALITLMYKVQAMGDQPWETWCTPAPLNNWG